MAREAESQAGKRLNPDGLSRAKDILPFIGVSRESWRKLVIAGKAPKPIKMGPGTTLFRNAEVLQWLADPMNYRAAE